MQSLSKSLRSSFSLNPEAMATKKQGIVSILGSDCENTKPGSIRRTLSADMSSKKSLIHLGFSPIKKIASSEELPKLSIQDSEEENSKENETPDQFDVWTSIQEENKKIKKEGMEKPDQLDIWSSIISQKVLEDAKSLPPPYVHPLVKRSSSSLSEKSLEICTESLGSETGSEGFSSYPPSETSDVEDKEQEVVPQQTERRRCFDEEEYSPVVKYKKSPPRSFPPPIPSLSNRDCSSLHMRSRRDNGRLLLEAVSVQSQNNFHAQREDGRLVLTFVNQDEPNYEEEKENDMEDLAEEFEGIEEQDKEIEEETEKDAEETEEDVVMDQVPNLSSGVINFHKLITMSKPMGLAVNSPTWPNRFHEMVKFEEVVEVEEPTPLAQSLPPRPQAAAAAARMISPPSAAVTAKSTTAAASLNAYEYYWTMASSAVDKKLIFSTTPMEIGQEKLLVLRSKKGEYLVPLLKGCKEPRSFLFWGPHCIATS
ncbi:protein FAF-like chloroplastic [Tripterygium wilfordii]|uniref:Protein FAF-like chloroplastic n=1 Tax=Tripterygium wilfordii TaxID=458696 RepID=A0A7J7DZF3_TRIWF|nr:protein FAF-like, chloroplastic [Tripterygium wilfordii]KAF5751683.1 protein FAF-like chloroplastic [Tripterygium wilfordii]